MKQFSAIIHPSAYQVNELANTMHLSSLEQKEIKNHLHHNLELATDGAELLSNERHTLWAMFDGHLHNAEQLQKELQIQGFHLKSNTHTELIIAAYDYWQEDFLKKISGSFALFLFDTEKNHLLIARDHLGQKPLYWTIQGRYFLISTQIKTLLATGVVPQTPSLGALSTYLYFGFIPQDLTPIQGVNKLLPGHYLKVDLNRRWQIEQYWSLSAHFEKKEEISKEHAYDCFSSLLEQAILPYTKKVEPTALLFPNSLGASSVAWFACHVFSKKSLSALTAYFPSGISNDDLSHQQTRHLNLSHLSNVITAEEIFEHLVSIVWTLDEPIADPNVCLTYALSKQTQKLQLHHCIADLGYEEAVAGSTRTFFTSDNLSSSFIYKLASLPKALRDYFVMPIITLFGNSAKFRFLRNIEINEHLILYLDRIALFKGKNRKKVSSLLFPYFDPEVFTQRFHRLPNLNGPISPSLYFDAKTLLPDSTLLQYERLFGALNITVSAPFLDHKLVEFLASLPDSIKYEKNAPAILLQNVMHTLTGGVIQYPVEMTDSFFSSFSDDLLFKKHFSLLRNARVIEEGYISPKWLKQALQMAPSAENFRQLWAILIFEIWFRLYIHSPIGSQNPQVTLEDLL